jgi:hypothetical protein
VRADRLDEAITEAGRFLAEAAALRKAHLAVLAVNAANEKKRKTNPDFLYVFDETDPLRGSLASAAVKRRSMDLTRALAELRKP